jgi:lycopene cyclase domain-containing protein
VHAWTYASMIVFVLVATLPLEVFLRTRVYARPRRLLLVVACAGIPFALWDVWVVHLGWWHFDLSRTWGLVLPGHLPVEEYLFFLVVPLASVMTLEAVRRSTGWVVGDEPSEDGR